MKPVKTLCASAIITVLASGIAYGHYLDDDSSAGMEAYFYRSSLMNTISSTRGVMRDMIRGNAPVNEAKFLKASRALAGQLAMIPVIFEDDGTVDESRAKPEIWRNWDDFANKAAELSLQVDEITRVAYRDGVMATEALVEDLDCGGCHDDYRYDRD